MQRFHSPDHILHFISKESFHLFTRKCHSNYVGLDICMYTWERERLGTNVSFLPIVYLHAKSRSNPFSTKCLGFFFRAAKRHTDNLVLSSCTIVHIIHAIIVMEILVIMSSACMQTHQPLFFPFPGSLSSSSCLSFPSSLPPFLFLLFPMLYLLSSCQLL